MRFRLAPNLSTLDDLERPKRPLAEVSKNSGAHRKNFNEDRPISLVGKCRPGDLCSRNIKYMRMLRGFHPRGPQCRILATYIPAPMN